MEARVQEISEKELPVLKQRWEDGIAAVTDVQQNKERIVDEIQAGLEQLDQVELSLLQAYQEHAAALDAQHEEFQKQVQREAGEHVRDRHLKVERTTRTKEMQSLRDKLAQKMKQWSKERRSLAQQIDRCMRKLHGVESQFLDGLIKTASEQDLLRENFWASASTSRPCATPSPRRS